MLTEKKELRSMIHIILALLLGALGLAAPAANAFPQGAPKPTAPIANPKAAASLPIPCCNITVINVPADMVTAQVKATGQTFQFKVNDSALVKSLRVGEAVWANFKTGQVSVDGKTPCGTIMSLGPAQGPLPPAAPSKAPSPPPAPQPGTSPRAAGGSTPQAGPVVPTAGMSAACCGITSVDARARLVAAKENSTGQAFEFSVPNSIPIQNLHSGQPVWANFKARKVSLDGRTACCDIMSINAPGSGGGTPSAHMPTGVPQNAVAGGGQNPGRRVHPAASPLPTSTPGGIWPSSGQGIARSGAPGPSAGGSGTSRPEVFVPEPQVGPSIKSLTAQPALLFGLTRDAFYDPSPSCSTIAVTLSSPAPDGSETVPASIDQPAIAGLNWPSDGIFVYGGYQTGSNYLCANPVLAPTEVHITVQAPGPLGGNAKTTSVTVWPPVLEAFAVGGSVMSTYRINYNAWLLGGAPPGGFLVEMTSSNPSLIPSRKFVIPENRPILESSFDYAPLVTAPTQVTLTAKGYIPQAPKGPRPVQMTQVQWVPEILPPPPFSGTGFQHPGPTGHPTTFTQTITIVPLDLALTDLKIVPPELGCYNSGWWIKLRVVMNHAAGHGGVQVQLGPYLSPSFSNGFIVPPYVTVPEGFDTGDFLVRFGDVTDHPQRAVLTVTATYNGVTKYKDICGCAGSTC